MSKTALSDRPRSPCGHVKVVLGPTNTGKTHFAVERMLGHSSGVIGLPLRLLAREVYDRVVRARGAGAVALITGEEKILPPRPAYFVCTVEAMPLEHDAAFVAVDEIQLCADFERGHIFTDRLLRARGREETMFMGSETIRPLMQRFLPDAEFITRPRFSQLGFSGHKKLTRLPPRSAVVAFSAAEVYTVAERMRRHRGGAAVVMGALSPRTRNAQVELYQNGDVDFLVATDAIGMGLNLDIAHVSFASTRKYDGFMHRPLTAAEVAQIAGRAGRHLTDGTFGLSGDGDGMNDFDRDLISAVEEHRFPPVKLLQWRNAALDFSNATNLIRSLEAVCETPGLTRGLEASDLRALKNIVARPDAGAKSQALQNLRRLWDACQIPDFRKISPEDHASLVWDVYSHVSSGSGILSNAWMSRHLNPVDRVDGDIDGLAQRIAHVRTLTYIANRGDWLDDPKHWQGVTAAVEDRLSDALHERLSQRFIDRRTSVLMRALSRKDRLVASIMANGEIVVEDQYVGRLEGFRFFPDEGAHDLDDKAVRNAAEQALGREIVARAKNFAEAPDGQISLKIADDMSEPTILWQGNLLARLKKGSSALHPDFELISTPLLMGEEKTLVEDRLRLWLDATIANQLQPLIRLRDAMERTDELTGLARGIAFQVFENLGSLPRRRVAQQLKEVDKDGRRQLRQTGLWLGAISLYLPALLKPQAARLRAQLWALERGHEVLPLLPKPGLITAVADAQVDAGYYEMAGYRAIGDIAVRLDMLERLFLSARVPAEKGPFPPDANMMSLVGCSGATFEKIMGYIGYSLIEVDASTIPVPEVAAEPKAEDAPAAETSTLPEEAVAVEAPVDAETPVKEPAETAEATPEEPVVPETPVADAPQVAVEVAEAPVEAQAEVITEPETMTEAAPEVPVSEGDVEPLKVMAFVRSSTIRPKRPPRRRREARGERPAPGTPAAAGQAVAGAPVNAGDKSARPHRPRRPKPARHDGPRPDHARRQAKEPVFDANSPFAVLMELKKSMAGKK